MTTAEHIGRDRRQLLRAATAGLAAASTASLFPSRASAAAPSDSTSDRIHPFKVVVDDEALIDLRQRISATRWPDKETDQSQGISLARLRELVHYWGTGYDWRRLEAKLNSLPQYTTTIDGVDIHFIQVRSRHPNALPVLVTHGWPGSIIEQLKIIEPLTNPTAHDGSAEDAFDVVIP